MPPGYTPCRQENLGWGVGEGEVMGVRYQQSGATRVRWSRQSKGKAPLAIAEDLLRIDNHPHLNLPIRCAHTGSRLSHQGRGKIRLRRDLVGNRPPAGPAAERQGAAWDCGR